MVAPDAVRPETASVDGRQVALTTKERDLVSRFSKQATENRSNATAPCNKNSCVAVHSAPSVASYVDSSKDRLFGFLVSVLPVCSQHQSRIFFGDLDVVVQAVLSFGGSHVIGGYWMGWGEETFFLFIDIVKTQRRVCEE